MSRSRLAEATLIGCLTALSAFCGLNARGGETYAIVAQSSRTSAATGRRPLAERIAAANLPIIAQSASAPATSRPREVPRPEARVVADRTGNGENMAVAAVRVDQQETAAPPPRPAATPPVLWPFGTKRPATPAAPAVATARTGASPIKAPQRQADARSSGNGLSSS
ncbi:MAG: hypothetical protein ACKOHG_07075, partial [Planctomycetia bacterium]